MSEKKKRQPLPHTRRVVRSKHGSIDSETNLEVRGARLYSSVLYKNGDGDIDLALTKLGAEQSDQNAENFYARLFDAANSLLSKSGEKTYLEALNWLPNHMEGDYSIEEKQDLALLLWQSGIANRKGALSPEATGVRRGVGTGLRH